LQQSNIDPNADPVKAGFYGIAYNWNGQTVIAYRGQYDISKNPVNSWRSLKRALGELDKQT
jgi:hypothetical protein